MQNYFITTIKQIQQVLRLRNSRTLLTLDGRIMIFKTLAISKIVYLALISSKIVYLALITSKIVYLALITNVPKVIVEELKKNQKNSYGKTHVLK